MGATSDEHTKEKRRRPRTPREINMCREAARKAHEKAATRQSRIMLLRTALIIVFVGVAVAELVRPDLIAVGLGAWALIPSDF